MYPSPKDLTEEKLRDFLHDLIYKEKLFKIDAWHYNDIDFNEPNILGLGWDVWCTYIKIFDVGLCEKEKLIVSCCI